MSHLYQILQYASCYLTTATVVTYWAGDQCCFEGGAPVHSSSSIGSSFSVTVSACLLKVSTEYLFHPYLGPIEFSEATVSVYNMNTTCKACLQVRNWALRNSVHIGADLYADASCGCIWKVWRACICMVILAMSSAHGLVRPYTLNQKYTCA